MPRLFGFIFRYGENHPGVLGPKSPLHAFLTHDKNRLHQYIRENHFDTVICTHVFSGMLVTETIKKYPDGTKSAFIATDYCTYPGMKEIKTDRFFIADESLAPAYEVSGISREQIVASGIPIRRLMLTSRGKAEAKSMLGMAPEQKHLLIMSGSMGCGPIQKTVLELKGLLPDDITVSVICGNNKKLKRKLERKLGGVGNIRIYGYTEQMSLFMDAADLYLTKPGGLSTAEAAAKALPMIFVNTVSGCEDYNDRFFVEQGSAVSAGNTGTLAKQCIDLLNDTAQLARMRNAYGAAGDASRKIIHEMERIGSSPSSPEAVSETL